MTAVPILILGDAPNLPTGLARIARDIATLLHRDAELGLIDVDVAQLGLDYDGRPFPWHVYPVLDRENWAQGDLERVWAWHARGREGILLTVWDPARCVGTAGVDFPGVRWGYFAVDGNNPAGLIGGPAGAALRRYHKVLAYTDYGARILKATLDKEALAWLPHGIDTSVFHPDVPPRVVGDNALSALSKWERFRAPAIGCVATNQPRKSLPLAFSVTERLGGRLWLHTDKLYTPAWSVAELADIYNLNDERLLVTLELTDAELAYFYRSCDFTIAPGLGEGFGYPIVESLACGTPVIHVDHAGGADVTPAKWRFPVEGFRTEGPYVIERPVVSTDEAVAAARFAYDLPPELRAYCSGAVAHLNWHYLWPRWRSWFRAGLEELANMQETGKEGKTE